MSAYYNEVDPYAAQWLRNLSDAGHIAPGVVDERDIRDVRPDDLGGFTQCHFFAGIGVWSGALRQAGWPDDRPVWTGSCPCPPFSSAGKGQKCPHCGGKHNMCHPAKSGHFICLSCGCDRFADARHLWPDFSRLIKECRPAVVFGEQVASKDGRHWLAAVQADMENTRYAFVGADTCAAGVGAPHWRQRLYFAAERLDHATGARYQRQIENPETETRDKTRVRVSGEGRGSRELADANSGQRDRVADGEGRQRDRATTGREQSDSELATGGELEQLADTAAGRRDSGAGLRDSGPTGQRRFEPANSIGAGGVVDTIVEGLERQPWNGDGSGQPGRVEAIEDRPATEAGASGADGPPGPVNGFWRDADWLKCRDGKWRPVEPGTFPLADGVANRVGKLRAYGNAINLAQASEFIAAYTET